MWRVGHFDLHGSALIDHMHRSNNLRLDGLRGRTECPGAGGLLMRPPSSTLPLLHDRGGLLVVRGCTGQKACPFPAVPRSSAVKKPHGSDLAASQVHVIYAL
jgi:hypothetical protein